MGLFVGSRRNSLSTPEGTAVMRMVWRSHNASGHGDNGPGRGSLARIGLLCLLPALLLPFASGTAALLAQPRSTKTPGGTFSINDGAAYTNSVDVTLTSSVTGAAQMRFGAPWHVISGGDYHTLALKTDGGLWAWGYNTTGQLGDGTTTQRTSPVPVAAGAHWRAVSGGSMHSLAIRSDGSLWAWGYNTYGQLGDGTTANRYQPVQASGAATWSAVAAGGFHTVALRPDGSLWAWGNNWYGQLGNGTTVNSNVPVRVGSDGDWRAAAAGYYHTLALKTDGTLWAWGRNAFGQLGDGTTTQRTQPVRIGPDADWSSLASGRDHGLAITDGGSLWAWGYNASGQLGDETFSQRTEPAQVGTDSDWIGVAGGGEHTLALKSDASLWAWGRNTYGQLGNGTTADRNSPIQVGTATDWGWMAAGNAHSVAVDDHGNLRSWGWNAYGQLGDGTTTNRLAPIETSGSGWSDWETYAAHRAWTLPPGDGSKTVHAEYRDQDGGVAALSDDIYLDTLPPTGSLSINDGAGYTNTPAVTLALTAADGGSGVALMRISNDGVFDSEIWEVYETGRAWVLEEGNGDKTVFVQYADLAGNVSRTITATILLDTTAAPSGTFAIKSGDTYTNSAAVTLDSAVTGATEMRFRNQDEPWAGWETYAATTSWTLATGDGTKTVEAEFRDETESVLALYDDIYLDETPPSGSVSIDEDAVYATTTAVTLGLAAADDGSGVSGMCVCDDGVFDTEPWESYATTKPWLLTFGDGVKTVRVCYTDHAGNVSTPYSDDIILDSIPPGGTLAINGGETHTNSIDVTLTSAVTGAIVMRFRNRDASWSSWEAYTATKSWTLIAGDGTKTVEAEYKDEAGNMLPLTDEIVLEPAAATLTMASSAWPVVRYGTQVTLSASFATRNGAALPGHDDIVLWSVPAGSASSAGPGTAAGASWTREATATDLGDGTYEATFTCTRDTVFEVRHAGDDACKPASSDSVTIMCYAYLSRPWTYPRTARRRRRFYVFGYLKPYHSGVTRLLIYRRVGGRWRYYSSPLARNHWDQDRTRYRLPYALRYPGYYLVRAYHRDRSHLSGAYSPYRVFRVR